MRSEEHELFREVQRFSQPWVWASVVPVALGPIALIGYGVLHQLVGGEPWGNNPMSDTGLMVTFVLTSAFGVVLLLLFYTLKLIVVIRPGALYLRFAPLHRQYKHFPLSEFSSHRPCTYRPIREYGGWGIRLVPGGRAYNVSGNRGVRFDYPDGKHILVGSQRAEDLSRAADQAASEPGATE
jgi:hypothetical protein